MRAHGVTRQAVAGIVAEPQHTRPGYRGATIYAGASLEVVVAEDRATVLAVFYPRSPHPPVTRRERQHDPHGGGARPVRRARSPAGAGSSCDCSPTTGSRSPPTPAATGG